MADGGNGGALRREASDLRESVQDLATRLDVSQRQVKLLRNIVIGLVVVALFAAVTAGASFVLLTRTNAFLAEGARSRTAIFNINDCIDPKGACAQRTQANTERIVKAITDSDHDGKADSQEIIDILRRLEARK